MVHRGKVMLATDGSPTAINAASWLNDWPHPEEVDVVLATVIAPVSLAWSDMNTGFSEEAAYINLKEEEDQTARQSIYETRRKLTQEFSVKEVILRGPIAQTLVDYAEKHDIAQIVLGCRGHSVLGNLLGSISFSVIQRSDLPVTVVG
ncbi:MAG: universal stress protein [Sulfobacillus benefaciens]|uniref:Universal stress protein n=1 Tax=Sulfobacillus benefaciens TaxID=453960 RepID=A0A2T2XE63_9FIRM|nr:MAG: universal stress protein [Sulfobacillus benefaciens]